MAYNEILNVGKSMASIDRLPPVFGQWLPLVVLAVGSLYLFYRSAYRVPRDGHHLWSPFTAVAELIEALRGGGRLKRQHPE